MRWLLLAAFLLAGCATAPVIMRHPDGRTAKCGGAVATGYTATAEAIREGQCISDFQRQGFERVATE